MNRTSSCSNSGLRRGNMAFEVLFAAFLARHHCLMEKLRNMAVTPRSMSQFLGQYLAFRSLRDLSLRSPGVLCSAPIYIILHWGPKRARKRQAARILSEY